MAWHIDTQCIQEGWKPKNGEPRVLPIVQSTTFRYDSAQTLGDLFDLKIGGDFYTRLSNPTTNAVEAKIAALEGGVGALLTSAGQSANLIAALNIAHSHGVPLIVDNTFPTPVNCRPFEFGADIVTHSTSKYLDGHATALGGVIVDSGNFDWTQNDKFPGLTTPDETYHGLTYTDAFGKAAYITKCRTHLMRDIGATPSPMNAFLLSQGIDTLFLRMQRHCSNAQKVAEYLQQQEKVSWVSYPGLPDNKYYHLARKYMPNGTCGVISFGVKGGREAASRFMENLKLAQIVIHVADLRTCVLHPASTTHRQMSDEQLAEAGVTPDLIRFSVGIENPDDIIEDIHQALACL